MIRLERRRAPAVFASQPFQQARRAAESFFRRAPAERAQERFRFETHLLRSPEVAEELWDLTRGKCAFCETKYVLSAPMGVARFRPASGALSLDGAFSADHYWWLAYEWENVLAACASCDQAKGNRFPVTGKRASPKAKGKQLESEQPLLLNPRRDEPQEHLVFVDTGEVVSKTERGRVTIEVLGLNRPGLIEARRAELTHLHAEWFLLADRAEFSAAAIAELVAPEREYAGLRRQFVATWLKEVDRPRPAPVALIERDFSAPELEQRILTERYHAAKRKQETYSIARSGRETDYFLTSRLVDRVTIENLRVIEALELDVAEPTTSRTPWLMLLGENGVGKSSILQAIALALVGDAYRKRLRVEPGSYLRRGGRRGCIEVFFTGASEPVRLEFSRQAFKSSDPDPKVLTLGYGATRLLPRPGARNAPLRTGFARVENLYNPFSPLGDATGWLLDQDKQVRAFAFRALKAILALDDDARFSIDRRARRVKVHFAGDRVALEELSDGYQSVLGLAVDIMSVLFHRWKAMEAAEGIVLIDELGSHLHPRWRMQIVSSLREAFPRVQFITSTHDPLCLRGLKNGEVSVLQRHPVEGIFLVDELPPIEGLRIDQLLTSDAFGLNSTIDPELDRLFERFYDLKAKWRLTPAEKEELTQLRAELDQREQLGQTPRERLMLEAIDDFLALERQTSDGAERRRLKESTKQELVQLWTETEPRTTIAK
jgi:AAA domain, putative AbiEii toxin, Type IV TA system